MKLSDIWGATNVDTKQEKAIKRLKADKLGYVGYITNWLKTTTATVEKAKYITGLQTTSLISVMQGKVDFLSREELRKMVIRIIDYESARGSMGSDGQG